MDIDLRNAIVILDEAHNIEDVACEAGGLELTMDVLNQAVDEFDFMVTFGKGALAHSSQMLFDVSCVLYLRGLRYRTADASLHH
jgi:hypothetical protein